MMVIYMPGPQGFRLRAKHWKKRLKFLGENVKIDVGVYFQNPQYISLDDNCWIDRNVIILAGAPGGGRVTYTKDNPDFTLEQGDVYIGKCTHIAPNCVLSGIGGLYIGRNSGIASNSTVYTYSHHYKNLTDKSDPSQYSFTPLARQDQQAMITGPVVIKDYSAIGLCSVILPGVTLEKGTWVASGSVISKSSPKQHLIYFNPNMQQKSLEKLTIKE